MLKEDKDKYKEWEKEILCKVIVSGYAIADPIYSPLPINFLAMINIDSGIIIDPLHPLFEKSIRNRILIFPNSIGSSVGAYVYYALKKKDTAPKGIICTSTVDYITASGCAISNIPLVFIKDFNWIFDDEKKEIILDGHNKLVKF